MMVTITIVTMIMIKPVVGVAVPVMVALPARRALAAAVEILHLLLLHLLLLQTVIVVMIVVAIVIILEVMKGTMTGKMV